MSSLSAAELTGEAIAANPNLWPREVTVNTALKVPLLMNGQVAGSMNLPAGRVLPVKSVSDDSVTVNAGGSALTVPITDTDLLTRSAEQQKAIEEKLAAAPAPTATATPKPSTLAAAPTPTPAPKIQNAFAAKIATDLVAVDGRKVKPFDGSHLAQKKYLAIYFSASWCPPCQGFTPELVQWYRSQRSRSDLFEVILVGNDRTEADMEQYMIDDRMPWPAMEFKKSSRSNPLSKFAGGGIPCLVIVDENGQKVLDSYVNGTYIGPRKVLQDFEKLLKKDGREA